MTARIIVRVFSENRLLSHAALHISEAEMKTLLPKIAEQHASLVAGRPFMIEIEFLDEPDVNQRFFRFGSDPRRMVHPVAFSSEVN